MKNRHNLSILLTIWLMVNTYDPFYRKVWVNIEADNINADSAEASYHVADAVASAIWEAMVFVLANPRDNHAVSTLNIDVLAESSTHVGKLARKVFPMETSSETDPESAAVVSYTFEVEEFVHRRMEEVRTDVGEMLKSLSAAHFGDTDGGEGENYAVARRGLTPGP